MKKYQFEEITAALSIIIALLAWYFGVNWLAWIYTVKASFDTWCAIRAGWKSAINERIK